MRQRTLRHRLEAAMLSLLLAAVGCDSLMEVTDPDQVTAESVDPVADAETFSRSAFQNFATAFGELILYIAWFTNEARVGDTFPTRNEFGRRIIDAKSNGTLNDDLWSPLSLAVATSEQVLELLAEAPDAGSNVNIARAAFASGYSVLFMAETFCRGTIQVGPPLTTDQMLDHAIARFQRAIEVGDASGGQEGIALADAARVGLARAYLFAGDNANAAATAEQVPADFVFEVAYVDDPTSRDRLGNNLYAFTVDRLSLVVGPEWRAIADSGDPRIAYVDADRNAQDATLHFYQQGKYTSWAAPIRLASGLEARYIHAEATGDTSEQLALINERRMANGASAFSSGDPTAILIELLYQKALEFWLEGQRMGDWRGHLEAGSGGIVPFIPPPGTDYYKPGFGQIGDQICWPIPAAETDYNPNL